MDSKIILGLILGIAVVFFAALFVPSSDSAIPPTRAFSKIFSGSGKITATSYNSNVTFSPGQNMGITLFPLNNTIRFSASSSAVSLEGLTNVTDTGCASGQARIVNATGWYVCGNIGTGDVTGAANVGTGQGSVFRDESSGTLNLKTIKEGSNISISNNADDITISATGLGSGNATSLNDLGDVIITTPSYGHILSYTNGFFKNKAFMANTITCSGTDKISAFNNSTGAFTCTTDQNGSGGFTSINNVGTGSIKLVHTNSSGKVNIKSITTSQGITLTNGTDTATINTNFKIDNISNTCSGTDKVSALSFNNSTGDWAITCSTDQSGGTTRHYLAGSWDSSSTKTNIGTSFVNIYPQTNSDGKSIYVDTNGFTQVRLTVNWNKIGTGTQTVQVVDAAGGNVLISLNVVSGFNDSGLVSIPAAYQNNVKKAILQATSTTGTDDPIFEGAAIYLR